MSHYALFKILMLETTALQIEVEHLFSLPSRSSQSEVTTKTSFYKLPLYFYLLLFSDGIIEHAPNLMIIPWFFLHFSIHVSGFLIE